MLMFPSKEDYYIGHSMSPLNVIRHVVSTAGSVSFIRFKGREIHADLCQLEI
jgi:hypothetical protein